MRDKMLETFSKCILFLSSIFSCCREYMFNYFQEEKQQQAERARLYQQQQRYNYLVYYYYPALSVFYAAVREIGELISAKIPSSENNCSTTSPIKVDSNNQTMYYLFRFYIRECSSRNNAEKIKRALNYEMRNLCWQYGLPIFEAKKIEIQNNAVLVAVLPIN